MGQRALMESVKRPDRDIVWKQLVVNCASFSFKERQQQQQQQQQQHKETTKLKRINR